MLKEHYLVIGKTSGLKEKKMVQIDEYMENDPIYCFNCDSEFIVTQVDSLEQEIQFCPFCGSDIESESLEEEEDLFDDESEDEDEED